jgi:hypothetical protein
MTNPAGQGATLSHSFPLVVNAIPPTQQAISVIPYESGDPVTETRLQLSASPDSPDGGADHITKFVVSGVPTDVSLGVPTAGFSLSGPALQGDGTDSYTITASGTTSPAAPELDVFAPAGKTTDFTLTSTAYAQEPNSPALASNSETQNIDVQYSTTNQLADFQSNNQSTWTTGDAFNKTFDNFLGVSFGPKSGSVGFTLTIPVIPFVYSPTVNQHFGGTAALKAGFESDLQVNAGEFNGQLPFNVTLDNTYNVDNQALEVDPSESQAGGGSFTTSFPSGSYNLDFVLDAFARVSTHGTFGTTSATLIKFNTTIPILSKNSSTLHGSFSLPDGIGSVSFQWPVVNTTGVNPLPGTITSQGDSKPVFQVSLDPIAIVLDAILGDDPLKGSFLGGVVNYTILAATVAPAVDVQQNFSLNASLPAGVINPDGGTPQNFTFGSPIIIPNSDGEYSLTLDPNATLSNDTSLAGQLTLGIKAIAGSIKLTISGVGPNIGFGPLFHPTTVLGPAPFATLYNKTFTVAFNPSTLPTVNAT